MKSKHITIWKISGVVLLWKLIQGVISWVAINWLSYTPTFPYAKSLLSAYGDRLLTTWAQFDGVHYLTIIERGYSGTGLIQAFFPLYPYLVKLLSIDQLLNPVAIGVAFSLFCFICGLFLMSRLSVFSRVEEYRRVVLLFLVFPTSFFLGSLYTESLFILLVIGCWYFLERDNYLLAGMIALLAALTRVTGVLLFIPLLWSAYLQSKLSLKRVQASIVMPFVGLGLFMTYLYLDFGDPLLFYSVQEEFGAARSSDQIVLLPQVLFRYFKMLVSVAGISTTYWAILREFIFSGLAMVALFFGYRRISRGWWWFCLLSFILPTFTGTFSSMPRYLLTLVPLFVFAGKELNGVRYKLLLGLLAIMQIVNIVLFTQGLWVA